MARERYTRKTYAGHAIPRRPLYPRLLHHKPRKAGVSLPKIGAQLIAFIALISVVSTLFGASSAYAMYVQVTDSLKPRLEAIQNRETFLTSKIYDRNGELLYEFFDAGKRTNVALSEISPLLIKATVAIEDKNFYTNPGFDPEGIVRTLVSSLRAGEETGGASTITQQVIKNIVLTADERAPERRYERKFKEIFMAQELDQLYTKDQVLELYLNENFYGNLAYGAEAASNIYFDVSAKDLSLAQASLLAGLPQLPSLYNPVNYVERDDNGSYLPGLRLSNDWLSSDYQVPEGTPAPKWRQIAVLRQMVDEGYATEIQARTAAAQDLRFADQDVPINAPHFVFYVRDLLEQRYGQRLYEDGLRITTTIDLNLQRMVQQKAAERIGELEERNIHNAAVVMMQPNTGQVLAMVGSIDYNAVKTTTTPGEEGNVIDGQVNVATRERQPGSALKPFTYLAAMEQGMTPATVLWDVPTKFPLGNGELYAPENYNGRWNGPVRMRTALANSLNMPAVRALKFAGIDYTLDFLNRIGIKQGLKRGEGFYGLSLTLGGGEVTPLELTTAYNTLASDGRYYAPVSILEITDGKGQILESFTPSTGEQVVDQEKVAIISDMLSDDKARAALWGLNSPLKLSEPAAVKTGTTNDWRDAWAAGYTPFVTVGVWTGNNNNEPTAKVESLSGGGIIWRNVMEEVFTLINTDDRYRALFTAPFDGVLPVDFTLPNDGSVQSAPICELPGPFGGYSRELFAKEMLAESGATRQGCDVYTKVSVVRIPDSDSYCRPVEGEDYPSDLLVTLTTWKLPKADPDERTEYTWTQSGDEKTAALNPDKLPLCSAATLATPTPTPEPTSAAIPPTATPPPPPVAGAIVMPNLSRLGENQARELLARLGVPAGTIVVDYQTRDKIPGTFDQFLPYTVVSTIPAPGNYILPGTTVVLGIRSPEAAPAQAPPPPEQPAPPPEQPAPTAPPQAPPPQEPAPPQEPPVEPPPGFNPSP